MDTKNTPEFKNKKSEDDKAVDKTKEDNERWWRSTHNNMILNSFEALVNNLKTRFGASVRNPVEGRYEQSEENSNSLRPTKFPDSLGSSLKTLLKSLQYRHR